LLSVPGRGVLEFEGIGDLQSPFPGTVISKDNISDPPPFQRENFSLAVDGDTIALLAQSVTQLLDRT